MTTVLSGYAVGVFSPDIGILQCPDCGTFINIRFIGITTDGKCFGATACAVCGDHVTIRAWYSVDQNDLVVFYMAGVPVYQIEAR